MVFFPVLSFFGPGLYTISFYSVCSLCFISLENPFKLMAGMMKALAAPLGRPSPSAFGTFLWQNSLNFMEVGAYLEEKKVLSPVIPRDDPPPGILYSNFQLSHLTWRMRQSWGKITFILPLPILKKLCSTITRSWIMFWLRLVWVEPYDIVIFVVKNSQILATSSGST